MTEFIKSKIQQRDSTYKNCHQKNSKSLDYEILQNEIENVAIIISERKSHYYNKLAQKLVSQSKSSKIYCFILKTFFNGKKIPLIPPLNVGNKIAADFKEKARLFNEFFTPKYAPIVNDSSLPRLVALSSESSLSAILFNNGDILKIIRSLAINKAHGHDNISIRMIGICDKATVKPLSIISKNCFRPVSLLPILGKILEKIMFISIFEYLQEDNLLCENQSGFQPYDSCEYQLLPIVHTKYMHHLIVILLLMLEMFFRSFKSL